MWRAGVFNYTGSTKCRSAHVCSVFMAVWPLRLRRMFCLCVVAQASLLPRHLLGDKSGERERERERKRKYEQLAARIVSEIDHPTPVRCDEEKKNGSLALFVFPVETRCVTVGRLVRCIETRCWAGNASRAVAAASSRTQEARLSARLQLRPVLVSW